MQNKKNRMPKLKAVYLIPLVFAIVACLVFLTVLKATKSNGPVYGDRCAGMPEISQEVIDTTISQVREEKAYITDLTISVNCKEVNINVSSTEGLTTYDVEWLCGYLTKKLDANIGYEKTNEKSEYSDIFGMSNGKSMYHVNVILQGPEEYYPAFGSKHPSKDAFSVDLNLPKDEQLAAQLQAEMEAERQAALEAENAQNEESDGQENETTEDTETTETSSID